MHDQRSILLSQAVVTASLAGCDKIFAFIDEAEGLSWMVSQGLDTAMAQLPAGAPSPSIVLVLPRDLSCGSATDLASLGPFKVVRNWAGNQSRFSRIKYAFLQAVSLGLIRSDERVVCLLGPAGKAHLDTLTIHDLSLSWTEEFPFDVEPLMKTGFFRVIMAVIDIALDIGALGREGKPVGTIFVVGDAEEVMAKSHQAVFNAFKGYQGADCMLSSPGVVESLKELAKLDGAIIIDEDGRVLASGRHLDSGGQSMAEVKGLGARHRAAAGISLLSKAVAIVVSESSGRLTIFQSGKIIASLEPLISRRLV